MKGRGWQCGQRQGGDTGMDRELCFLGNKGCRLFRYRPGSRPVLSHGNVVGVADGKDTCCFKFSDSYIEKKKRTSKINFSNMFN